MKRRIAVLSLLATALHGRARAEPSSGEAALIERLIAWVGSSKGVVFIRNGVEADAAAAAKHMRNKYDYFRKDIRTADDFIRLCATRSEMTKKAYAVRLPDGRTLASAEWLSTELKRMRAAGG